jgi:hypothetical protein
MKKILVLLALMVTQLLPAQVTEEKTAFTEKPRGERSFELERGQSFYSFEGDGGWYKARKEVYFNAGDFADKELLAGTKLRNKEGEVIGKSILPLKLYEIDTIEAFRGEDSYKGIIQAYAFQTNIEERSIPEEEISQIFALKSRNEQQERFEALWDLTNAEEKSYGDLTAYIIREDNRTLAEQKDFRLIMIFRGSTSPYAIISNGHTISAPKIKDNWEDGDFKITYFYKATDKQRAVMDDILLENLAL